MRLLLDMKFEIVVGINRHLHNEIQQQLRRDYYGIGLDEIPYFRLIHMR